MIYETDIKPRLLTRLKMSSKLNKELLRPNRYRSARNLQLDCRLCHDNKHMEAKAEFLYLNCPLCLDCWATQMKAGEWTPDTTALPVCELLNAFASDFRITEMKDPQVDTDYLSSK